VKRQWNPAKTRMLSDSLAAIDVDI